MTGEVYILCCDCDISWEENAGDRFCGKSFVEYSSDLNAKNIVSDFLRKNSFKLQSTLLR